MKMHITVKATICALLFILGCSNFPGPKEILTKYLDATLKGKKGDSYVYLSNSDKSVKSLEEYAGSTEDNPIAKAFSSKISYEIKEIKITGKKANAIVTVKMPDYTAMMGDIMGAAFSSAFGGKKEDIEKVILEKYKDKNLPMTTTEETYVLTKEKDGWKLFFNWEIIKKMETVTNQVKQLLKDSKPDDAKAKYQELLALDKTISDTSSKIKELGTDIDNFKEIQEYIPKIVVKNIQIGESILDEMGVWGEIKNTGERTLDKVEITIYCIDKSGKTIFEKNYHPVFVSEYSFSSASEPLKPNYSRKFGVKLDDAPSDWARKVNIKVTDVVFKKD